MSIPTCWCGEPATWYSADHEFVCDDDRDPLDVALCGEEDDA